MADMHEYEVEQPDGTTITMQLTDEDAERFPNAKKLGKVETADTRREDEGGTTRTAHEPVGNRARRSK